MIITLITGEQLPSMSSTISEFEKKIEDSPRVKLIRLYEPDICIPLSAIAKIEEG